MRGRHKVFANFKYVKDGGGGTAWRRGVAGDFDPTHYFSFTFRHCGGVRRRCAAVVCGGGGVRRCRISWPATARGASLAAAAALLLLPLLPESAAAAARCCALLLLLQRKVHDSVAYIGAF